MCFCIYTLSETLTWTVTEKELSIFLCSHSLMSPNNYLLGTMGSGFLILKPCWKILDKASWDLRYYFLWPHQFKNQQEYCITQVDTVEDSFQHQPVAARAPLLKRKVLSVKKSSSRYQYTDINEHWIKKSKINKTYLGNVRTLHWETFKATVNFQFLKPPSSQKDSVSTQAC